MKRVRLVLIALILVAVSCAGDRQNGSAESVTDQVYTCPMHPEIESDQPGNCPKCNMKLVLKQGTENSDLEYLLQPTNEFVVSEINTTTLVRQKVKYLIRVDGSINYDLQEIHAVTSRVSGRVEKLYVYAEFEPVKKGQKLVEIYSEELVTEQENYIFLLTSDAENTNLIHAAEKRLELLGMDHDQLAKLKENKTSIASVVIKSPYTGHLHSTVQNATTGNEMNTTMSALPTTEKNNAAAWLREGAYVSKGENLFSIYSTRKVWAILNIPAAYLGEIKTGIPVKIWFSAGETDTVYASINYVEPVVNESGNTLRARVYLTNPDDQFKIGSLLNAELDLGEKEGYFVPETAVVSLGNKQAVFIKQDHIFVSRIVHTGMKRDGLVEIISGISEGEKIAVNAQMMVDSESFIKIPVENKE
ncbi:MAG: efflux RND transporter periplasmic adaptor subunit [Bacteroidetes bacterium]|nr:efflux RND transporter periplasmic adaptor subunit [Bacteroidota bacterium]